ncbi:GIY-YIG nuclease family protein [Finegoldia sp. BIOML-A3]|uniref:GIY-YIG nuclease family protein n=1 Tax=Finegoldia TaxID=150022 RepID=UPI000B91AF9F|nr:MULTISPECIES: GIY-YIG nuclease family protein [Finegoldia]MDU2499774.1 GIY-YIG nuclease family protein [Finegoldia magna]MDU2638755.1 GIY-YIG nuclease family protein [Finegoldia magna]MDU3805952.1 GIY-YIG nuclease family protein [Finegoldia magna]MDU4208691.1 GIY-YIG nuclease family protein [Finegoldia magna]MDU5200995.1 GIY-YIG nuclease family protein [Finegoldia magna]
MYYLYILECADKSLYTGITNDFSKRIKMHNKGKASKYTRARLPVNYVFMKKIDNKSDALKLEIKTKSLTRDKKLKLINSNENEINAILKKA